MHVQQCSYLKLRLVPVLAQHADNVPHTPENAAASNRAEHAASSSTRSHPSRGILRSQLFRRCHVTLASNIHTCLNPVGPTIKADIANLYKPLILTATTAARRPNATTVAAFAEQAAACMGE
jgi:hypothetical protein